MVTSESETIKIRNCNAKMTFETLAWRLPDIYKLTASTAMGGLFLSAAGCATNWRVIGANR